MGRTERCTGTLVFRFLNVFTFVYACRLFQRRTHRTACPVNSVVRHEQGSMK